MALALRQPIVVAIAFAAMYLSRLEPTTLAAGLDDKGKSTLKDATRLYKQGHYEEAAKLLTELAVDHPEMANLQRNLGASYYYLRRPEPALSNLRSYLASKKNDITPDDKAEVERWIDEMEKLRALSDDASGAPRPDTRAAPRPVELRPVAPSVPSPQQPSPMPPQALPVQQPSPSGPVASPPEPQSPPPVQPDPAGIFLQAQPQLLAAQEPLSLSWQTTSGVTNGRGLRVAGIACGALGLASVGTAVYFHSRATSLSDKITHANPASASDYQAGKDAESMQWVFYGIGTSALATGAVLYLLGHSKSDTAQVGVAPVLGPGAVGVSAQGAF